MEIQEEKYPFIIEDKELEDSIYRKLWSVDFDEFKKINDEDLLALNPDEYHYYQGNKDFQEKLYMRRRQLYDILTMPFYNITVIQD